MLVQGLPPSASRAWKLSPFSFRSSGPRGRRRFDSTKPTELRFRAMLREGDSRVIFHLKEFGRLKEDLA